MFTIYYDSLQEGKWFQGLNEEHLGDAVLQPFPGSGELAPPVLVEVLAYDRPDIVLVDDGKPILVLERTSEVPSGHNVGQRFARLAAAAQLQIPVVYFGPYAAYKHGGATQGPRYMNLRLFYALEEMARIEETAVTIINWPVDEHYELIKDPSKDSRVIDYLKMFFSYYDVHGLDGLNGHIMSSAFERQQEEERKAFIEEKVTKPEQYDVPPPSVQILKKRDLEAQTGYDLHCEDHEEVVLYNIGMNYIRSDPYAGAAMLYSYLYCGGMQNRHRHIVLHFPNITTDEWYEVAHRSRKDVRLFRLAADGIMFVDDYLKGAEL